MAYTQWEYLSVRFDFKGRGITQEFSILDVNGERVKSWAGGGDGAARTLPELLSRSGEIGWELVSHVVNQDNRTNGVTLHYLTFKRPKAVRGE